MRIDLRIMMMDDNYTSTSQSCIDMRISVPQQQPFRRRRWHYYHHHHTYSSGSSLSFQQLLYFTILSVLIHTFSICNISDASFILSQQQNSSYRKHHQLSYICRDRYRHVQPNNKIWFRQSTFYRTTLYSKSKKDSSDENINNDENMLLRNIGGFVPFFASQQQPPQPKQSELTTKKDDVTNVFFWGNITGWFRRDTTGIKKDEKKVSIKKIDTSTKKKNINKKDDTIKPNKKKQISNVPLTESTQPSLSKFQNLISFNFTKSEINDDSKSKNDRNSTNTNNPLSVVQKFASSFFKDNDNVSEETWYPVFPKTRIMPGEIVPVTVAGVDLLVIASIDGRSLYGIANSCPHLGTPLETGKLTRLPIESKPSTSSTATSTLSQQQTTSTSTSTDVAIVKSTNPTENDGIIFSETDISNILSQDGCEDCIICPLHHTAFALKSGEVRGEWCPYPPVIGKMMGTMKAATSAAVFDVRTRGRNIEVRFNSLLP